MKPFVVYFSSVTENTARFVEKLQVDSVRLPLRRSDSEVFVKDPYVLLIPTYGGSTASPSIIPKQVIKFLNVEENRRLCVGIVGTGNRNFGESYLLAAKQVAKKLNVPLLGGVELAGMPGDEESVKKILEETFACLKDGDI